MIHAIDVSHWQGEVDFGRVRAAGIEAAVIKSSQGRYLSGTGEPFADPAYHQNMRRAIAAGMGVSIYHFFCAANEDQARQEGQFCASLAGGYRQQVIYIFCDVENYSNQPLLGQSRAELTANVVAFLDEIRRYGFLPAIYANRDHLLHHLYADRLNVPVWEAAYTSKNPWTAGNRQIMWQYTSTGSVAGVNGNVDRSECYFDPGRIAIPRLQAEGVISNARYWQENLERVRYLGTLFDKVQRAPRGDGTVYTDVTAATKSLAARGIIARPDYWKRQAKSGGLLHLDTLLCKLASR